MYGRSFFDIQIANDYVYKSTVADFRYRSLEVSNTRKTEFFKMALLDPPSNFRFTLEVYTAVVSNICSGEVEEVFPVARVERTIRGPGWFPTPRDHSFHCLDSSVT